MPLGSSRQNTIWCLEQVLREFSEDMIISWDFRQKWDCMGNGETVMIWTPLRRDYIKGVSTDCRGWLKNGAKGENGECE